MDRTPALASALAVGDQIVHKGSLLTIEQIVPASGGVLHLHGAGQTVVARTTDYVMRGTPPRQR